MRSARLVFWIAVTSLLQWLINGLSIYVALWSFGVRLSPQTSLVVMGVVAVAVTIPSSPGFFGVIQGAFVLSLEPLGVAKADAFAASIYYHISQYIPVTLIGLYYLNRSGLRLGELNRSASRIEEEGESEDAISEIRVPVDP